MKKLLKIAGWMLLAVVFVALGAGWWMYTRATAYYQQRWAPHQVSFAVPFPLSQDELTALREQRVAAGALAADPLVGVDLEAVARDRAIARTSGAGGITANFTPADWDHAVRHAIRHDLRTSSMPSEEFQNLSDHELSDVVSYIRSRPPADRAMRR